MLVNAKSHMKLNLVNGLISEHKLRLITAFCCHQLQNVVRKWGSNGQRFRNLGEIKLLLRVEKKMDPWITHET